MIKCLKILVIAAVAVFAVLTGIAVYRYQTGKIKRTCV